MAEHTMTRLWTMRALFIGLALVLVLFKLLPLEFTPRRWAGPDLVICFCFVWVLRRPEYVPVLSIAAVVFFTDLMLQRPPGLLAALVVIATQNLKSRSASLRNQPFSVEWLSVTATLIAIAVANRIILAISITPQAPFGLSVIELITTILAYPLVMLISIYGFGLRKSSLGEVNALGQRL